MTNSGIQIDGNWYAPLHYIKELKGVVKAELLDTTSSAGDWSGYFVKKIKDEGKTMFEIWTFSQENNWPQGGFTLYMEALDVYSDEPTEEEVYQRVGFW